MCGCQVVLLLQQSGSFHQMPFPTPQMIGIGLSGNQTQKVVLVNILTTDLTAALS